MKKYFLLLISYLVISCHHQSPKLIADDGIIQKDTMIKLLADMHLADAAVQDLKLNTDSSKQIYKMYYQQIFNRYKTNTKQFKISLQFYTQHPDEMDMMYEKVIEEIGAKTN
ncbi:MAG: hypothetical protein RJA07_1686 [Bacteroidota bacterium]|jgi:hypothetical protein